MDSRKKKKLNSLITALDALCEVNESMPIRQAMTLLVVAAQEADNKEADMREVGRIVGAPSAVVSRDLLGLGKRGRTKKGGLELVESFEDYTDLRRKPYRTTAKGKDLINRIMEAL